METLELLFRTIWLRPYVFIFMATYLAMVGPIVARAILVLRPAGAVATDTEPAVG